MTSAWGGMSRVTTAPAAMKAWWPMRVPQTMVALAPTLTPSSRMVFS